MTSELLILSLDLVKTRVVVMGVEMRKTFIGAILVGLIEKTQDIKVMKAITKVCFLIFKPNSVCGVPQCKTDGPLLFMQFSFKFLHFRCWKSGWGTRTRKLCRKLPVYVKNRFSWWKWCSMSRNVFRTMPIWMLSFWNLSIMFIRKYICKAPSLAYSVICFAAMISWNRRNWLLN